MATSDDDRIAYLAGEPGESLTAQERAELDELDALLKAPATWAQPDPGLEDRIVATIAEEARRAAGERPRAPAALFQLAIAAASSCLCAWRDSRPRLPRRSSSRCRRSAHPRRPQQFAMVVSGTGLAPRRARVGDADQDELRLADRAVGGAACRVLPTAATTRRG